MDDKIKRLAEQAGWDMGDEVCGFTTRLERFAELLVQEKNDEIERLQKVITNMTNMSNEIWNAGAIALWEDE